jgi:hypothetical protein
MGSQRLQEHNALRTVSDTHATTVVVLGRGDLRDIQSKPASQGSGLVWAIRMGGNAYSGVFVAGYRARYVERLTCLVFFTHTQKRVLYLILWK